MNSILNMYSKLVIFLILSFISFNIIKIEEIKPIINKEEYNIVYNWIELNRCKKISDEKIHSLINLVYINAKQTNTDPHLILSIIKNESCFDTNAVSQYNAVGYMQVIAKWHPEIVGKKDLTKDYVGISAGTKVLKKYIKKNKGDINKALLMYSGGDINYYKKIINTKNKLKIFIAYNHRKINV